MSQPDVTMAQGDTLPMFSATLADANGPVDLASATAITISATGPQGIVFTDRACTLGSGIGTVSYAWQAGDTAVAGWYQLQVKVAFGASVQHFPTAAPLIMEVAPSLA